MSTTLARKFALDVTSDLTLASGWVTINGINDLDPEITPNNEDASDYGTNGWSSVEPTMQAWTLQSTFFRRQTGGVYDPGQELVRACVGQFGASARIGARWYDRNGGPEAYSGIAIPSWKRSNTAVKNLEQAQVTFTGTDVPLNMGIVNPSLGTALPVILSATPTGAAAAAQIAITGTGFKTPVATTGVKIGGVNATSWVVVSDNLIVFIVPAGTAGSAPIIVTTAAGASTAFAYTRA